MPSGGIHIFLNVAGSFDDFMRIIIMATPNASVIIAEPQKDITILLLNVIPLVIICSIYDKVKGNYHKKATISGCLITNFYTCYYILINHSFRFIL